MPESPALLLVLMGLIVWGAANTMELRWLRKQLSNADCERCGPNKSTNKDQREFHVCYRCWCNLNALQMVRSCLPALLSDLLKARDPEVLAAVECAVKDSHVLETQRVQRKAI